MKVTEHEMRGLLTGKCVPADMLVNEELPAYLVRKFADLHSDIKKQETAYAQAVDSILMALKDKELVQDRLEDTEDKLQKSREKLDTVLAENAEIKSGIADITFMRDDDFFASTQEAQRVMGNLVNIKTTASDAILNEVRAEAKAKGVEEYAESLSYQALKMREIDQPRIRVASVNAEAKRARDFAAQLRSGSNEGGV